MREYIQGYILHEVVPCDDNRKPTGKTRMATRLFVALACMALVAATQAQATTYNINYSVMGLNTSGTIAGTITTDGTTGGGFTAADITDYNLTLTVNGAAPPATLLGPLSGNNSTLTLTGGLIVTAADMSFDFGSANQAANNQFSITTPLTGFSLFSGSRGLAGDASISTSNAGIISGSLNGAQQIGLAVTPLPAALPLFGAGLGVMGLFGRRRRRKASLCLPAAR